MTKHTQYDNLNKAQSFKSVIKTVYNRENPYVQLNKEALWDSNLSLKAVGLWARCMSRPDNWTFCVSELAKSCKEGRKAIDSAIAELIAHNYALRILYTEKDDAGKFTTKGSHYIFFAFAATEEEKELHREEFKKCYRNCRFGNLRNGELLKKESSKEDIVKKEEIHAPSSDVAPVPFSIQFQKPKAKRAVPSTHKPSIVVERASEHSECERFNDRWKIPLVGTTEEQHQLLVEKHGEKNVKKAYEELAEWKISKAEADPGPLKKHTDYRRVTKWVMKVIKEQNGGNLTTFQKKPSYFRREEKPESQDSAERIAERKRRVL